MPTRTAVIATVLCLVSSTMILPPVMASTTAEPADESRLHIDITESGEAIITLISVYTLTDDDENDAFDSLKSDEGAKAELLDRLAERMESVASSTDSADAVTSGSIDMQTTDETGIVAISVEWEEFAGGSDGTLVVREPIDSGFVTDRPLVIDGPSGWAIESVSPEPDEHTGTTMTWEADTTFNDFELVLTDDSSTNGDDALPGFGFVIALLSIGGIGLRYRS